MKLWNVILGEPYDEWNYLVEAPNKDKALEFVRLVDQKNPLLSVSECKHKGPVITVIHTGGD